MAPRPHLSPLRRYSLDGQWHGHTKPIRALGAHRYRWNDSRCCILKRVVQHFKFFVKQLLPLCIRRTWPWLWPISIHAVANHKEAVNITDLNRLFSSVAQKSIGEMGKKKDDEEISNGNMSGMIYSYAHGMRETCLVAFFRDRSFVPQMDEGG